MDAPVIRVTEDTTAEELAEAITHLCGYAKRQMHHPDCVTWRAAHERIDTLLFDWQRARGLSRA